MKIIRNCTMLLFGCRIANHCLLWICSLEFDRVRERKLRSPPARINTHIHTHIHTHTQKRPGFLKLRPAIYYSDKHWRFERLMLSFPLNEWMLSPAKLKTALLFNQTNAFSHKTSWERTHIHRENCQVRVSNLDWIFVSVWKHFEVVYCSLALVSV